MADGVKIDRVRSTSSGVPGRSLNSARTNHFVLDSPNGPNEAVTNGEAFLSGISSCAVTLIELYAREHGIPLTRLSVGIEGVRALSDPARFQSIRLDLELAGVDQARAAELVEVYQRR